MDMEREKSVKKTLEVNLTLIIFLMAEQERFELSHQLPGLHP